MWNSIASLIRERTSCFVSAAATHPGRSGTKAPKLVPPCSITTVYFAMYSCYLRSACFSILFNVPGGTSTLGFPAIVTVPGIRGMPELLMASACSHLIPAVALTPTGSAVTANQGESGSTASACPESRHHRLSGGRLRLSLAATGRRYHRVDELTAVWVPDDKQEAIRGLTRART